MGITVVLGRYGIPSVADQNFVRGYVDHPQHFKQLGDFANLPMIYFRPTALVVSINLAARLYHEA